MRYALAIFGLIVSVLFAVPALAQDASLSYDELFRGFATPDHAKWGEVPLWWWEGASMTKERVTAELETLAAEGVKAVCPIQRSPGRCDPQSFSPEWWDLFAYTNEECKRLGMSLWAYDQVGYGHYGWLEKAAAQVNDPRTKRVVVVTADGTGEAPIRVELPDGDVLSARAYPLRDGLASDEGSLDMIDLLSGKVLEWTAPEGAWRLVVLVIEPFQTFYLSDTSGDAFIDMFYGKLERTLGADSMGTSFAGIFQDEHPPTPRDIYTEELAEAFQARYGYDITRAIPALHFDVGPLTPKYRTDFLDVYLGVVEHDYWKRVYDWTWERGLLTSHDNWGRNNINTQSQGYIDYFRTQRWFSAPGYDDSGQRPLTERNYYDTKIASSIARLYERPRVWNEAFHSSGWGRTTDQTVTWLSAGMAFGANLYDEHGLYYATRASTWEHAAPDPHWRQPYWRYYDVISDFVARSSYIMSQGRHVVDVGVHYPVASLLAGEPPNTEGPDYNRYMALSRTIYYAGIDNDIVDDDSILNGNVSDGFIMMAGNGYQALVFGPETTIRRGVLEKALQLVETGGTVLFAERLPSASIEGGRNDPELAELLEELLGAGAEPGASRPLKKTFERGGYCAFVPGAVETLPTLISEHIVRDFTATGGMVFETHRRVGDTHVYLVQSAEPEPFTLEARCRVDGVPELWDPFTGEISPVQEFERLDGFTTIRQPMEGNTANFLVVRPGEKRSTKHNAGDRPIREPVLPESWEFSVMPTRDNRWGEFRWPPSNDVIGPEVRTFRYREENGTDGVEAGWHTKDFNDADWRTTLYSTGPYWLVHPCEAGDEAVVPGVLGSLTDVAAGPEWQEVRFSQSIGLAKAAPWGGHSGYPDGHIDKNFIDLPEGRKLLFTRIRAPKEQRRGLRVELSNSTPRLWVNGEEQPFEEAVGNLPLREGENTVLLDLPDGGHGRLFVQAEPPTVSSMAEAAQGGAIPEIEDASWIWEGSTQACYVRKTFELSDVPRDARLIVSAYSGFRLFVNGEKIEEEIGPWANWQKPETFTITPLLQKGRNVIAIWGQLFAGQNVNKGEEAFQSRGIVLALKVRMEDGSEVNVVTDDSWKGTVDDHADWESVDFDESAWPSATVRGHMGDAPWGIEVVQNVGAVTETKRPLSVNLESPYLVCFDEVPDLVYDVKPADAPRVGWYRFEAPPGLRGVILPTGAASQVWIDGAPTAIRGGWHVVVSPPAPPKGVSTVAVRFEMQPGAYSGAAFPVPIKARLEGGTIGLGLWSNYALPTYSGIGVYTQTVELDQPQPGSKTWLDLGQVLVAAEVLVNGDNAGVRVARPFKFDISDLIHDGENTIEVRVANTIAPHYTTIPAQNLGPTESGLIGPVRLIHAPPPSSS